MSGPMGGHSGYQKTFGPAGRGKKRFVTKGFKLGSYVIIKYKHGNGPAVDYEGKIVDKRVGSEDKESFVELKNCLTLNEDGKIVAIDASKRLIDSYIEECKMAEKRETVPQIEVQADADAAAGKAPAPKSEDDDDNKAAMPAPAMMMPGMMQPMMMQGMMPGMMQPTMMQPAMAMPGMMMPGMMMPAMMPVMPMMPGMMMPMNAAAMPGMMGAASATQVSTPAARSRSRSRE
eukprot:TRINITY_DN82468_c0_g1_i1.p1 TRINITY_DN82468_c0_g1~~TRINITY_DN82468_c0_g1_i1.p1  ORF type:complete len:232 (+),score=65.29 TRINITY_DN82468_c0_g1_i1:67-762(+)